MGANILKQRIDDRFELTLIVKDFHVLDEVGVGLLMLAIAREGIDVIEDDLWSEDSSQGHLTLAYVTQTTAVRGIASSAPL